MPYSYSNSKNRQILSARIRYLAFPLGINSSFPPPLCSYLLLSSGLLPCYFVFGAVSSLSFLPTCGMGMLSPFLFFLFQKSNELATTSKASRENLNLATGLFNNYMAHRLFTALPFMLSHTKKWLLRI